MEERKRLFITAVSSLNSILRTSNVIKYRIDTAIFNHHRSEGKKIIILEEGLNIEKPMDVDRIEQIYMTGDYTEEGFHLLELMVGEPLLVDKSKVTTMCTDECDIKIALDLSAFGKHISIESNTDRKLYFVMSSKVKS